MSKDLEFVQFAVVLTYDEAYNLASAVSDVLCFFQGYRAGRQNEEDHSSFIELKKLRELNGQLKDLMREHDNGGKDV